MCEVLFINHNRVTWQRGMPVTVKDDGWKWTEAERSKAYVIKKLPGISRKHIDIQRLLEPDVSGDSGAPTPDFTVNHKRRYRFKVDEYTVDDDTYLSNQKIKESERITRLHSLCEDLKFPTE